jgi:imidazolonepropionase-like amidohydrolase
MTKMHVIDVETGEGLRLRIEDGRFAEVTPHADVTDCEGWALPGLVDVHNHLSLASPAGDAADAGERVRASASLELALGVLAIREPGSPDGASQELGTETGWPRIVTMGRFLAPPGRYFPGLAREIGERDLAAAALEEVASSGGWAKVIGDFIDEQGVFGPNWSRSVLTDTATAVHEAGGRVAVHAVCPAAVDDAIAAGFDSIEHGWAVKTEHFEAMKDGGIAWVPTLIEGGAHTACLFAQSMGIPEHVQRWMQEVLDAQPAEVAGAAAAGVTVLAGTDAGQAPHGRIVEQIEQLAAGGMSTRDALAAGSWVARRYLGLQGIEPGAFADLVVYDEDPARDPDALRRPRRIVLNGEVRYQASHATR